eukprot:m.43391 g.43391  ORF g.43391 m.43391 type:complete len:346 (+) comp19364_c0_seq2:368-1405(+)
MSKSEIHPVIISLAQDASELYLQRRCPVLNRAPTSLEFYREYVSMNRPCVFNNLPRWPAHSKWNKSYLCEAVGEKEIAVEATPTGRGDDIHDNVFVMPESQQMTVSQFFAKQEQKTQDDAVFYISHQDSNLTGQFDAIVQDVKRIEWATEAFGAAPDATNIWIGPDDAVTSLHKDHYENMYTVIRGTKIFTIYPPTDVAFMHEQLFKSAQYVNVKGKHDFDVVALEENSMGSRRPWIPVDPRNPDLEKFPHFKNAKPLRIEVTAGQTLYLPSLWFHHVAQRGDEDFAGCTLAVNFWYDMQMGPNFAYFRAIEALSKTGLHSDTNQPTASSDDDVDNNGYDDNNAE